MKDKALRLSSDERRILRHVDENESISSISEALGLPDIAVLRAGHYLSAEGLFDKDEDITTFYATSEKAKPYVENGLPEIQIFRELSSNGTSVVELFDQFSENEVNASIGRLKEHGLISLGRQDGELHLTPHSERFSSEDYPLQDVLINAPVTADDYDTTTISSLVERGLLVEEQDKTTYFSRTNQGDELLATLEDIDIVETLTTEDIEQGTWKDKTFRHYRITSQVDPKRTGRRHFVKEAIDEVKDFWVSLGFKEMRGNHVQSAFWDLDALFVPQDHPARDLQDTFYLDKESDLPDEYVQKIKDMHEKGGEINSEGWDESFDISISKKTLLRTHTTVLSAQQFGSLSEQDLPVKYFSVDKNYRNETIDWSHLMEFHQVEGIVVTQEGSLARLISYLEEFFGAMGYDEIRLRPAFFPYTEPSAEVDAYNEEKEEWVEIGGAGVIRPEVTEPLLGFRCPVLAWGTGLERLLTAYYDIHDLRKLYDNDIKRLQEMKVFDNA